MFVPLFALHFMKDFGINWWTSRKIITSSAFSVGSYLGGRWYYDGAIEFAIKQLACNALMQNHFFFKSVKKVYTSCCMTKLPLGFYVTNDTAITHTFSESFESLHFEQCLNNTCNSILPMVVILLI